MNYIVLFWVVSLLGLAAIGALITRWKTLVNTKFWHLIAWFSPGFVMSTMVMVGYENIIFVSVAFFAIVLPMFLIGNGAKNRNVVSLMLVGLIMNTGMSARAEGFEVGVPTDSEVPIVQQEKAAGVVVIIVVVVVAGYLYYVISEKCKKLHPRVLPPDDNEKILNRAKDLSVDPDADAAIFMNGIYCLTPPDAKGISATSEEGAPTMNVSVLVAEGNTSTLRLRRAVQSSGELVSANVFNEQISALGFSLHSPGAQYSHGGQRISPVDSKLLITGSDVQMVGPKANREVIIQWSDSLGTNANWHTLGKAYIQPGVKLKLVDSTGLAGETSRFYRALVNND